jgi:hypothetical protein
MGYDAAAVLSTWSERGWILVDRNTSSPTKTSNMPNSRMSARFVAITRQGYEGAHRAQQQDIERETKEELKKREIEVEQQGIWG